LRTYSKHIAIFLLAVISAFIVPKELVHAFYDHSDTVHAVSHSDTGLPVVENAHQHCDILNFNVPLYFLSLSFFKAAELPFSAEVIQQAATIFFAHHIGLSSLRAPPVR
jgi:hypothetical protein